MSPKTWITRLAQALIALVVAGSFAVGVHQARASAAAMPPNCTPDDPNYCETQPACDSFCMLNGHPLGGSCGGNHCCLCFD
jgi:hypothetical protein